MTTNCLRCRRERKFKARGLCDSCYTIIQKRGEIEDYPRTFRKGWDVLEDYEFIKTSNGGSLQQIADRMGMKKDSLQKALSRQGIKHV